MKRMRNRFAGQRRMQAFSLVELLIVIAILGVLTTLILPQFGTSEEEAQAGADKYNAGLVYRQLKQFKAIEGRFPSVWHTGLTDSSDGGNNPFNINGMSREFVDGLADRFVRTMADRDSDGWYDMQTRNVNNADVHSWNNAPVQIHQAMKDAGINVVYYGPESLPVLRDGTAFDETNLVEASLNIDNATTGRRMMAFQFKPDTSFLQNQGAANAVTVNGKLLDEYAPDGGTKYVVLLFLTSRAVWGQVIPQGTGNPPTVEKSKHITGTEDLPASSAARAQGSPFPYFPVLFLVDTSDSSVKLLTVLNWKGENEVNP